MQQVTGGNPAGAMPYAPPPRSDDEVPFEQTSGQQQPAQTLTLDAARKLADMVKLPEGRERCFGHFSQSDMMCRSCPEWIKQQCVPQSSQESIAPPNAELEALKAQLEGTTP
jgi:hypothetical protein